MKIQLLVPILEHFTSENAFLWLGKITPVLVLDGIFDKEKISSKFKKASNLIESELANFISNKLLEYE